MSRCSNWSPIVDRFQKRLSTWKCKNLSYGGRLTLIKSVLGSLGVYFFSTFKAPVSIIKKLESIRRDFFWGGNSESKKIAWIAWDKVVSPRDQGGLNIGSLKVFNQAMLTIWWWRFLVEENALWRKVIVSIHGTCGGLNTDSHTPYKSGPWYQILKMKYNLSLHGPPLRYSFPQLYRLELNSECIICDRAPQSLNNIESRNVVLPIVNDPSFAQDHLISSRVTSTHGQIPSRSPNEPPDLVYQWAWSRMPWTLAEQQELSDLMTLLSNFCLSNDNDYWECTISNTRLFSVKDIRSHISKHIYTSNPQPYRWNNVIPIKINICSWRIIHKIPPTRSNLNQRDAINLVDKVNTPNHLVCFFDAVVQSTIWFLWRFRNDMCFSLKRPSKDLIFNDIKLASYNWISSRVRTLLARLLFCLYIHIAVQKNALLVTPWYCESRSHVISLHEWESERICVQRTPLTTGVNGYAEGSR
ncbi:hypothetical protein Tco_1377231 [Tanacetum coccineum]